MLGLKFLLPKRLGKFADDLNALYHALGFHTPICIENMPIVRKKLAGERFSELERVLAKVESSRCGLLLDTGHYFIMRDCRISQSDTLSRTLGVHVHNNYGQRDDHNYICDGVHDPGPLLKQVLAAAPEAKLILENYSMDFGAIVKSIEYLNNLFR